MRFFSRLIVNNINPASDIGQFINRRFELADGTNAKVAIRTDARFQ